MRKIEDIKEFEDIDTYYEISKIVEEVFQDRVEAHKHLVTANKEILILNNRINALENQLQQKENIIKEVREYIMTELITEWDIKNNGCVSGSDLPANAITPILEILDKVD